MIKLAAFAALALALFTGINAIDLESTANGSTLTNAASQLAELER